MLSKIELCIFMLVYRQAFSLSLLCSGKKGMLYADNRNLWCEVVEDPWGVSHRI